MAEFEDVLRAALYAIACGACVMVGLDERRTPRRATRGYHPTFWFVAAGLLLVLAVGRLGFADRAVTAVRRLARTEGWYDGRRLVQVVALATMAVAGVLALAALVRWLPNRRRYLLPAGVLCALCCFGAVRAVSLHQVDTLIYGTSVSGIRLSAVIEAAGALAVVASTCWFPFEERPVPRRPGAPLRQGL
jgi:hypothetical protein